MPEAQIILSEAAMYVATALKSNSAICAIEAAMKTVENTGNLPIPPHLQDAHYKSAGKLGHGTGYLYAHDFPNDYVGQQYLPDALLGTQFSSGNLKTLFELCSLTHRTSGIISPAFLTVTTSPIAIPFSLMKS